MSALIPSSLTPHIAALVPASGVADEICVHFICLCFFLTAYAQTPSQPEQHLVFLTHRRAWLASGGFNPNIESKPDRALPDYAKEFRKRCPKVTVTETETQSQAEYAITIDEKGIVSVPDHLLFI
jgi:hypothetical protein